MKGKTILIFIIAAFSVFADEKNDVVKKMLSDECATKGNCGYKPTRPDVLDSIPLVQPKLSRGAKALPSSADLSRDMPPVLQQDGFKCVAWSTAYYLRSYQEKKARNWSYYHFDGSPSTDTIFSPIFVYNQINNGVDEGASITDALNVLVKKGAALWRYMPPYSGITSNVKPSPEIFKHASKYKAKEFKRIKANDLISIKSELASGNPLVFGMVVDSGFRAGMMFNENAEPYDKPSGYTMGGHAMTLVGYDDDKKGPNGSVGAFKIINSWGEKWANKGYGWITYRMFISAQPEVYALYNDKNGKLDDSYTQEEQDGLRIKIVNPKSAQASAGTYSDKIILSWSSVPGISKYAIFKKDISDPDSKWETGGHSESDSFNDTEVESDKMYKYKIFSVLNSDDHELMDNEDTAPEVQGYAKAGKAPSVPVKVTGLSVERNIDHLKGAWSALKWNKIYNASSYEIMRFEDSRKSIIGTSKDHSFDDSEGSVNAKYSVRAVNTLGKGQWSDAVSLFPEEEKEGLQIPSGLKASSTNKDKIELKWNSVNGASYYTLKRTHSKTKEKKEFKTEGTVYTDTDIIPGRIYHYTVSAGNASEKTKYCAKVIGRTVKSSKPKEPKEAKEDSDAVTELLNSLLGMVRKSDTGQSKFAKMLTLKKEESLTEFMTGNWTGRLWTGNRNTQEFQIKLTMDEKKFSADFIYGKTVKKITGTVIKGADFIEADGFKMQKVFDKSAEVTIYSNTIYPTPLELNFSKD